ncbi:unnamed protein product [Ixodes hexagonus]
MAALQLRPPSNTATLVAPLHWGTLPPLSPLKQAAEDKERELLSRAESPRGILDVPAGAGTSKDARLAWCSPAPVPVPPGWRRSLVQGRIVYFSPSHHQLCSVEEVATYLQTEGVCKCGLDCPLALDKTFSFDPAAPSQPWSPGEDVGRRGPSQRLCRTLPSAAVVTTTTTTTTSTRATPPPAVVVPPPTVHAVPVPATPLPEKPVPTLPVPASPTPATPVSATSVPAPVKPARKETTRKRNSRAKQRGPFNGVLVSQLLAQLDRRGALHKQTTPVSQSSPVPMATLQQTHLPTPPWQGGFKPNMVQCQHVPSMSNGANAVMSQGTFVGQPYQGGSFINTCSSPSSFSGCAGNAGVPGARSKPQKKSTPRTRMPKLNAIISNRAACPNVDVGQMSAATRTYPCHNTYYGCPSHEAHAPPSSMALPFVSCSVREAPPRTTYTSCGPLPHEYTMPRFVTSQCGPTLSHGPQMGLLPQNGLSLVSASPLQTQCSVTVTAAPFAVAHSPNGSGSSIMVQQVYSQKGYSAAEAKPQTIQQQMGGVVASHPSMLVEPPRTLSGASFLQQPMLGHFSPQQRLAEGPRTCGNAVECSTLMLPAQPAMPPLSVPNVTNVTTTVAQVVPTVVQLINPLPLNPVQNTALLIPQLPTLRLDALPGFGSPAGLFSPGSAFLSSSPIPVLGSPVGSDPGSSPSILNVGAMHQQQFYAEAIGAQAGALQGNPMVPQQQQQHCVSCGPSTLTDSVCDVNACRLGMANGDDPGIKPKCSPTEVGRGPLNVVSLTVSGLQQTTLPTVTVFPAGQGPVVQPPLLNYGTLPSVSPPQLVMGMMQPLGLLGMPMHNVGPSITLLQETPCTGSSTITHQPQQKLGPSFAGQDVASGMADPTSAPVPSFQQDGVDVGIHDSSHDNVGTSEEESTTTCYVDHDSEELEECAEGSEECENSETFFTAVAEQGELVRPESGGFSACCDCGSPGNNSPGDSFGESGESEHLCARSVGVQSMAVPVEDEGSSAVSSTVIVRSDGVSSDNQAAPEWETVGTEQEGHISSSTEAADDSGCSALDLSHMQQQDFPGDEVLEKGQLQEATMGGRDSGVESSHEPSRGLLTLAEEANIDVADGDGALRQRAKRDPKRRRRELLFLMQDEFRDDSDEEERDSPPLPPQPRTFDIGDLVWGQIKGFPSWPGKLVRPDQVRGHHIMSEDGKLWVQWFGDHTFTQVEPDKLKTLSEGLEAHHRARKKYRRQGILFHRGRKLNGNLENAIQEAMMELDRQTGTVVP